MRKARRRRAISMTPLVDVIFLLLLFFMLSSTFTRFAEVELSSGGSGAVSAAEQPLFLQLSPDRIMLNGAPVAMDALAEALRGGEDGTTRPLLVALRGQVTAQRLTDLLVALRGVPGVQATVLRAT